MRNREISVKIAWIPCTPASTTIATSAAAAAAAAMVIVDSPRVAQKYLRRVSKDFSTVRRYSYAPQRAATPPPLPPPSKTYLTPDAAQSVSFEACDFNDATIGKSESLRGIRRRHYARKRSSVSSTLTRVLILNVRDLLKVADMRDKQTEVCRWHPHPVCQLGSECSLNV